MSTQITQATPEDVLHESFVLAEDGFWYPAENGDPLVRVALDDTGYQIYRRRFPHTTWVSLVRAHRSEFDAQAFRTWRANWRMVV
jgi:hypothetical protein